MAKTSEATHNVTSEGFRDPPERVTEPCVRYMARITELRSFINFYFNFVKSSWALGQLIPSEPREILTKNENSVVKYDYSIHRPFVNEVMLSRAAESFDFYLTTILRDIFFAKPEMLKSEGNVDISTVIEIGNYEDLILRIVDRKVHDLSYKPLIELQKFISSRTGIDLFESRETFEIALIASEVRNLIAHGDCITNDLFRTRTKGIAIPLDVSDTGRITIDDIWLRRASYTFDQIVFRFDEMAAEKFGPPYPVQLCVFAA